VGRRLTTYKLLGPGHINCLHSHTHTHTHTHTHLLVCAASQVLWFQYVAMIRPFENIKIVALELVPSVLQTLVLVFALAQVSGTAKATCL
jgi:hypothetical protein